MAYVLKDFRERHGWSNETSNEIANKILNQNTKEVLKPQIIN